MKNPPDDAAAFAQTREQMHRQMLSAVSHDLKTPLATIIGALEVYERMNEKLTPEKKESLIRSALGEAYRLDNFITNILDMGKLEAGMITLKPEKLVMKSLLNDCLSRLGPRAKRHTIELHGDEQGAPITTDLMLFGRAVGLVLDNAIKHAGREATIAVHYGTDANGAYVRVRDNGRGIPAGKEEAIFSKYTRIAHNDNQNAGTGLGLPICRLMMQALGGTVEGVNHEQGGAEFTLRCPRQ
ncbi:MAG: sensor histidine kinase [Rickettsiales bacterium]